MFDIAIDERWFSGERAELRAFEVGNSVLNLRQGIVGGPQIDALERAGPEHAGQGQDRFAVDRGSPETGRRVHRLGSCDGEPSRGPALQWAERAKAGASWRLPPIDPLTHDRPAEERRSWLKRTDHPEDRTHAPVHERRRRHTGGGAMTGLQRPDHINAMDVGRAPGLAGEASPHPIQH